MKRLFTQGLQYLLMGVAVLFFLTYLWIVARRITYPFQLEWVEGGMLQETLRILQGQSLYSPPSVEFVSFLYPPLYFYASALVSLLFGPTLFSLRLVSFLASLVSLGGIFAIVQRETQSRLWALVSAGLFIAGFRATGAWLDIGRVDSLFLAFYVLALYFISAEKTPRHAVAAGVCAALSFLSKQTALTLFLPLVVVCFVENWRQATIFLLTWLGLTAGVSLFFYWNSGGWYLYYVFSLLNQQTDWIRSMFISFWWQDLFAWLPVAISLAIFYLAACFLSETRGPTWLWSSIWFGALASAFLTRVKAGGYVNVLLPAFATTAILFGLGASRLAPKTLRILGRQQPVKIGLYLLCIAQFALLAYNPGAQIPTQADLEAGQQLVQRIARLPGDVYLPNHGYLAAQAGKKFLAHHSAIWDVMRGDNTSPVKAALEKELKKAVRQKRFSAVLLDSEKWYYLPGLPTFYQPAEYGLSQEGKVFLPVTGAPTRPKFLYLPK